MENQELQLFKDTVKYGGEDIFIQPFCDAFGISYRNQCRVITKDKILQTSSTKKSAKLIFGDERRRVCLTPKGFIRWIQLINVQIVHPTLREKLEFYQNYIFDFLYGNWEERKDMSIKNARLVKLQKLYGRIGNEIQIIQKELKNYVQGQLSLDHYTPKKLR